MVASNNIITFIKGFEVFTPVPYWDYKQWSWGYGTKAPAGAASGTISKSQAHADLAIHVKGVESAINSYVINKGVALNQNQYDAMVSLVYNVGTGNIFTKKYNNGYSSGSTLYNKLLQKNYSATALHFKDFVKAGGQTSNGLKIRRAKEAVIFSKEYVKIVSAGLAAYLLLGILAISLLRTGKK